MKTLNWVTVVLVIIGAINWGLTALGYNVVEAILGGAGTAANTIYVLVGLAGVYMIFLAKKAVRD